MAVTITKQAEAYLEAPAKALEIPPARYEQAERSYKSLGEWLHRDESSVQNFGPDVFVQGSFRLGTVIKPESDGEEYDVDCACSLTTLTKSKLSQAGLKQLLGEEIKAYRKSKGIQKEVHEGRRSWRLEYADGAHFHMDIVPCIPNAAAQRLCHCTLINQILRIRSVLRPLCTLNYNISTSCAGCWTSTFRPE